METTYRKADGRIRPALTIGVRVKRKPVYFYVNYFGPLFLIGNLNGVALLIPPSALNDRSQIILTLILTLVAFKIAIANELPQVRIVIRELFCFILLDHLS